jgi:hypothetical protein
MGSNKPISNSGFDQLSEFCVEFVRSPTLLSMCFVGCIIMMVIEMLGLFGKLGNMDLVTRVVLYFINFLIDLIPIYCLYDKVTSANNSTIVKSLGILFFTFLVPMIIGGLCMTIPFIPVVTTPNIDVLLIGPVLGVMSLSGLMATVITAAS